jgi:hypothetical protein
MCLFSNSSPIGFFWIDEVGDCVMACFERVSAIGRGPKVKGENSEKNSPREAFFHADFPKIE